MKRTVWLALTMIVLCAFGVSLLHAEPEKKQEAQQKRVDAAKAYKHSGPAKASRPQRVDRPAQNSQWPKPPAGWLKPNGNNPSVRPPQKPDRPSANQQWPKPPAGWLKPNASNPGVRPPQKPDRPSAHQQWTKPQDPKAWGWDLKREPDQRDQDRKTHPPKVERLQKIERRPPHEAENAYGPVYRLDPPRRHGTHHDHDTYYYYYDYPTYNYYETAPRGGWDGYGGYDGDCDDYDRRFPPGPHLIGQIIGAEIWAADGTFLGVVGPERRKYESITNPDGPYGNPYSPLSILNPRSPYGAARGPLSCWDPETWTPPRLFWHGEFVGYLTANRDLHPRTGPGWIMKRWFQDTPWYRL